MAEDTPLVCPDCRRPLTYECRCPTCGYALSVTAGVYSPLDDPGERLTQTERLLLGAADRRIDSYRPLLSVPQSEIEGVLGYRDHHWVTAFRDWELGSCLDLAFGHHTPLLGHLAQEVYALDESVFDLRVLDALAESEDLDNVTPIHVGGRDHGRNRYPVAREHFDTVVLRYSDASPSPTESLDYLDECGRLLVDFDATAKVCKQLAGSIREQSLGEILERLGTAFRQSFPVVRRRLGDEFESVTPLCNVGGTVFRLDRTGEVLRFFRERDDPLLFQRLLEFAQGLRGTRLFAPRFVLICADTEPTGLDDILVRGNHRAVSLSLDGNQQPVRKVPLGVNCSVYNRREREVLETVRAQVGDWPEFPRVELTDSRFGSVLFEEAARGQPLSRTISADSYRTAFKLGWKWLGRFQRETDRSMVDRSARAVREDLSVNSLGLTPPAVEPGDVPVGPVHGDFQPKNVFVESGSITTVSDWEYASTRGVQIVDATQYVLRFARTLFGSLERGVDELLDETSPFGTFVRRQVDRYCDSTGITPEQFYCYLAFPYVRFVRRHEQSDAFSFHTDMGYMTDIVEYIWERTA
jgi:hypothetical protein